MAGGDWFRGGIFGLLDLIEEHKAAVEYDFLTRFHLDLDTLPDSMGWDTAARQVRILRSDPSSMLAAAMEGWDHPVSRLEALLMDLWDLTAAATGTKKPPKYPRQWVKTGTSESWGNVAGRTRSEIDDLLTQAKRGDLAPV